MKQLMVSIPYIGKGERKGRFFEEKMESFNTLYR